MEDSIRAFYSNMSDANGSSHRHFVYVRLSEEQAKKMIAERVPFIHYVEPGDTVNGVCFNKAEVKAEVHLTTDYAFTIYCQKRLTTPKLLLIMDSLRDMNELLEEFNFVL